MRAVRRKHHSKEKDFEVGELADREGIEDWRIKRKILTEIVK